ncbi:MAG: Mut7-C RNAse domain-containing protein [bacterium]
MQDTIDNQPAAAGPARLTCDAMLGKLSRELRAQGVDVQYHRGIGGMRAYRQALGHDRLFLTRANRLKELPGVLFVESNDPAEQVVQVRERLGLAAGEPEAAPAGEAPVAETPERGPESRCRDCNAALERISRDQARPSIPFFIYQIHHDFSRCPNCKRVFWPGSHTREAPGRPRPARPGPRRGRGPRVRAGGKDNGGSPERQQPQH